jgi:hypothetical protein
VSAQADAVGHDDEGGSMNRLGTPLTLGTCLAMAQVAVAAGTLLGTLQARDLRPTFHPVLAPLAVQRPWNPAPAGAAQPPGWENIPAPVGLGWG